MNSVAKLSKGQLWLYRILPGVFFLCSWQLLVKFRILDSFFFSSPSAVAQRIGEMLIQKHVWGDIATTALESSISFLLGSILGCGLGFLLGRSNMLANITKPYLRIGNAMPRIVLAPIFLLWFGLGIWSKIALGVTVSFFIVCFNTYEGMRSVPTALINNARMLGASNWQLNRYIYLPSIAAWIFSSLHLSVGFSIIAVIVGEYLGASSGIGYMISQAEGVFDTTGVFAGIGILSLGVLVVSYFVDRIERSFLGWKFVSAATVTEQDGR